MKLITFSGVDGSGKSTQLALLREKLERENWNVAYFHAVDFSLAYKLTKKNRPSLASSDAKALADKKATTGKQDTGNSITKASWFSIFLRKMFLIIDLIRFRFYFTKLKKENCDYLLSDRYFYDSIINIEYLQSSDFISPARGGQASLPLEAGRHLQSLIPHPSQAFYFDANPEEIMHRERVPEQGIEYLSKKQELFKQKIAEWNMIVIDANRDKEVIFNDIISHLPCQGDGREGYKNK